MKIKMKLTVGDARVLQEARRICGKLAEEFDDANALAILDPLSVIIATYVPFTEHDPEATP